MAWLEVITDDDLQALEIIEKLGHHGGVMSVDALGSILINYVETAQEARLRNEASDANKARVAAIKTLRLLFAGCSRTTAEAAARVHDRFHALVVPPGGARCDGNFVQDNPQRINVALERHYYGIPTAGL